MFPPKSISFVIWSIANKLRGTYQSDKYKDVIIPMVIIRRFECALAPTKAKVLEQFKANPKYPAKAMYGRVVILKDNNPKYLLIDLDQEALIYDLTEEEKLEIASRRIMKQHKPDFEELAK